MSHTQEQHERANIFALELLIPETMFRDKVKSGITSCGDLAEYFQVPVMAIRHKARILGMGGHELTKGFRQIK